MRSKSKNPVNCFFNLFSFCRPAVNQQEFGSNKKLRDSNDILIRHYSTDIKREEEVEGGRRREGKIGRRREEGGLEEEVGGREGGQEKGGGREEKGRKEGGRRKVGEVEEGEGTRDEGRREEGEWKERKEKRMIMDYVLIKRNFRMLIGRVRKRKTSSGDLGKIIMKTIERSGSNSIYIFSDDFEIIGKVIYTITI